MRRFTCRWLAGAAALLALSLGVAQAEPVEIQFWHAMPNVLGERVTDMTNKFNASQDKYKVVPSYKGTYTEVMTQAIAAYRAGKQPQILQVFEVGTQTMMLSGAVEPVADLMKDQGYTIDWQSYIQPVISYYETSEGKLMSMPFNSSTPIFYYNEDELAKAGIKKAPKTWQDVDQAVQKLKKSGQKCAFTSAWQSWVQIENFSALHNIPFASQDNGYKGLDTVLQFNNPKVVAHIALMQKWAKEGALGYYGRDGRGADAAFVSGECAMLTESSAGYGTITGNAKFKWSAAPLPVNKGTKPINSIIGGATLWVLKGGTPEQNAASAAFLNYVASPDNQVWWHEQTGYLPITIAAYDQAKASGYYKQVPVQAVGIEQLTRAKPTPISRGLRLGNFVQIRTVIDEELENVWSGKKNAKEALNDAVRRGNDLLRQFEQSHSS